jgi:O-antigen ligase
MPTPHIQAYRSIASAIINFTKFRKIEWRQTPVYTTGILASLLFGYSAASLPTLYTIALVAVLTIVPLALNSATSIAFLTLITSFGLIPFFAIDFRVASELVVYGGTALILLKLLFNEHKFLSLLSPFKVPLIAFTAAWLIALLIGYVIHRYAFAITDARRYTGLLSILLFSYIEFKKPGALHRIVLIIAAIAAAMLCIQFLTGIRVFAGAKGFMEGGVGAGFEDIARGSAEGGNYLVAYAAYYLFSHIATNSKNRFLYALGFLLCAIAIIATFSRGLWAGFFAGFFVLFLFSKQRKKEIFFTGLAALGACALLIAMIYPIAPRHIDSAYARIFSIESEGGRGTSLGSRLDENNQAIDVILKNGLTGIGHGGEYKIFTPQAERGFVNEATFIHNSYLWVVLKLGVLGAFSVLYLIYKYVILAIHGISNKTNEKHQLTSLAATGVLAVYLINGLTSPVWAQFSDLVAFGALMIILTSNTLQTKQNIATR